MFITAAAAALSVMAAAGNQAAEPQAPAPDATALPVSVERIGEALQRPALHIPPLPEPTATFHASVEDTAFETVLEGMRRELAIWNGAGSVIHPPGAAPGTRIVAGVDVLPLVTKLITKVKTARARNTVREELAAFCAEHDCSVLEGEEAPPDR